MKHIKCLSASFFAAIFVLSVTAWGQTGDTPPPAVQGGALDVAGWLLNTYGPAGLAAVAAWRLSGMASNFKGIPLVIEVRVVKPPEEKKE